MRFLFALCCVVQACSERAAAIRLRTHGFALVCDWRVSPSCPFLVALNAVDAWSSVLAAKGHLYREMQYNAAVKEQLQVSGCYDCGDGWRALDFTRDSVRTGDSGSCLEIENLVSGSGFVQVALEGAESCELHVFGDVSSLPTALEALRGTGGTLRYHFTMLRAEVTPEPEWVSLETFQEDYTGGTMSGPFDSLNEIVEEAWRLRRTSGLQGHPSGPYPEFAAVGVKNLGAALVRDVSESLERVISALRLGIHLGPVTENFTLPRYNPKTFKRLFTSKGNKDALDTRRLLKSDAADFLQQALLMQQVLPTDYPFLNFSLITSDVTHALRLRGDVQRLPASLAVSFTEPLGSALNAVLAKVPNSEVVDVLDRLAHETAGGVARLQHVYGSRNLQPPVTSFPTPLVFLNGVQIDMEDEQQLQAAINQENQTFLEWLLSRPPESDLLVGWMTHLCSMTECTDQLWADSSLLVTPTHARFTPRLSLGCWRALANTGPVAPTAATAGALADVSGSPVVAGNIPLACFKSRLVPYLALDTCDMVAIGGLPFPVTDSLRDLGGYLRFLLSHARKAGAVLLSDLLGPTFFVGPEMSAESIPSKARGLTVYVAANPLSVVGQQLLLGLDALQRSSDFQVTVSPLLPPSPENAALRVGLKLGVTANDIRLGIRAANVDTRTLPLVSFDGPPTTAQWSLHGPAPSNTLTTAIRLHVLDARLEPNHDVAILLPNVGYVLSLSDPGPRMLCADPGVTLSPGREIAGKWCSLVPGGLRRGPSLRAETAVKLSASRLWNRLKVALAPRDRTVNVFMVVMGPTFERLAKVTLASVRATTTRPIRVWLIEDLLTERGARDFKRLGRVLPSFQVELVSLPWPEALPPQTAANRVAWAYKILFLDLITPLDVGRIIYLDSDQLVRGDLGELVDFNLDGAPYGFPPFCRDKPEMSSYRFWETGFWKQHLGSLTYHISALFVVDLETFKRMGVGNLLRETYLQLARDPLSLSNLDQDLPNYIQKQAPIATLPVEWLWCATWCSDETKLAAKVWDLCSSPVQATSKLEQAQEMDGWLDLERGLAGKARDEL